jgi:hypothetical protein
MATRWTSSPLLPALASALGALAGGFLSTLAPSPTHERPGLSPPATAGEVHRDGEAPWSASQLDALRAALGSVPARLDPGERGAIADEVARACRHEAVTAQAPPPPDPGREPSPEASAARDEAAALLASARSAGEWLNGDAAVLRRLLPQLERSDAEATLRGMAASINAGQLRVRTSGPPF